MGQGTFLLLAVEDLRLECVHVSIYQETGTGIGGRGGLTGTNQFQSRGFFRVLQLPALRLHSAFKSLGNHKPVKPAFLLQFYIL